MPPPRPPPENPSLPLQPRSRHPLTNRVAALKRSGVDSRTRMGVAEMIGAGAGCRVGWCGAVNGREMGGLAGAGWSGLFSLADLGAWV
jgi:hypothetical protein